MSLRIILFSLHKIISHFALFPSEGTLALTPVSEVLEISVFTTIFRAPGGPYIFSVSAFTQTNRTEEMLSKCLLKGIS